MATSLTQAASVIAAASKGEDYVENLPVAVPNGLVAFHDKTAVTNSKIIADVFGKEHRKVVRDIEVLLSRLPEDCQAANFAETKIDVEVGNGATVKVDGYELTRDAFFLLAMGFTGSRALEFKLNFINAFNLMEAELMRRDTERFRVLDQSLKYITTLFGSDDTCMKMALHLQDVEDHNKELRRELGDLASKTDRLQMKKGDALLKNNDNLLKAQRKFMNDNLRKTRDPFKRIRKLLKDRPYEYEPTLRAELAAIEGVIERIAACGE